MNKPIDYETLIRQCCDEMADKLIAKNRAYGNSAMEPVRIFSKADPLEQINVRLDDKLSRIMKGEEYAGDDNEFDLEGYLVLKRVCKMAEEMRNSQIPDLTAQMDVSDVMRQAEEDVKTMINVRTLED